MHVDEKFREITEFCVGIKKTECWKIDLTKD